KKKNFDYYQHGLLPAYYYQGRPYPGGFPPRKRYSYTPYPERHVDLYRLSFSPSPYLASVVMDRRLIDEDGREIGQVKDLLIDFKKKQITKIILASIRLLGKDIYVAIPYKPLKFAEQGVVYEELPGSLKDYIYPYQKTISQ
ncbi:MAG: PRC-barrel domain-containing protein, partial [Deltaproteobacteria bacterium]|nr:PRC-barrel domain-containing protein [Deltaproteobacteria bacterium]